MLSFAALAVGTLNIISLLSIDQRIGNLEQDQDSICTAVWFVSSNLMKSFCIQILSIFLNILNWLQDET